MENGNPRSSSNPEITEDSDLTRPDRRKSPVQNDPLVIVKHRVYLAAIAVGLPAILLLWITSGPANLFAHIAFPSFALFCLVCAWLVWNRTISLRLFERTMFAVGSGFAFAQLAYALYASDDLAGARTAITEVSYLTLTVLYVAAYLVFDSRTALRVSLILYGLGLALVIVKVFSQLPRGLSLEEVSWLLRMHGFMGAVIFLIYASSYTKDQLLQQKAVAETMRRLAHTDQLTGIANRRQLYFELRQETEKAGRYERPLSLILFDLDHFKYINDTYGHDCGDAVLKEVARAIEPLLRKTDRFGRWGGEEFVLLAPETDLQQSNLLAERLREGIAGHRSRTTPSVTASFGLAQYNAGESPETLINRADEALYKAKTLGRNRVVSTP